MEFTQNFGLTRLFTAAPSGRHSYLYGWLLSSGLFWCAMAVSVVPALFGKRRFSCATLAAFVLGLLSGMALGPHPEGAAWGQGGAKAERAAGGRGPRL